jgi:hypothetical protein
VNVCLSRNRRRNIRKVLDDGELDERTKHLLALEKVTDLRNDLIRFYFLIRELQVLLAVCVNILV